MSEAARKTDKTKAAKKRPAKTVEKTKDGHHVIIDGRKWRATNPNLPEEERQKLVNELMSARREVGRALKAGDKAAEDAARDRVQTAKEGLGERGPKWWEAEPGKSEPGKTQAEKIKKGKIEKEKVEPK